MKNNIGLARKSRGMTQTELAELLGVKPARISRIEKGENSLGSEQLKQIADILDVSADFLLCRKNY